ncbi:hypothetical protein [Hymenobacter weizhouensis]|uniref:hypothetical protein n=1 Tax=Hymenobacter sp. YIM 151500-1 TaxID=2987689 RepID=UPI00222624EA|nr:hypothetical protein [Hymenobacter sp. YIM 151500-1]UYZ64412.1 hypothetical protein OIS53_06055 [Hymenobacter sp. YIM 151500-1]
MKKLCCLIITAVFFQLAQAQTVVRVQPINLVPGAHATPTRTDDTILVELTDTPEAGWRRLAQVLVGRGYSIAHSDKDLLTVSTHVLELPGHPFRVTGMVIGRTVVLRLYLGGEVEHIGYPTRRSNRGGGNSWDWRELEAIARELGGPVQYATSAAQ